MRSIRFSRIRCGASFVAMALASLLLAACRDSDGGERRRRHLRRRSRWRRRCVQKADRMGRVHRPLRGDGGGRGARSCLRLSAGGEFRRRRHGEGGRRALRHRSASLPSGRRPRESRSRQRQGAVSVWATSQLERAQALVEVGRHSRRRRSTSGCRSSGSAEAAVQQAEAALECGAAQPRLHQGHRPDLRPRLQPPHRHRQPGHRRPERDAAHHHRDARPALFRLRHERGGFSRLSARRGARRRSLDPRPPDDHRRRGCRTRRTGRIRAR